MKTANMCDDCSRTRATLFERERRLICFLCLPDSWLSGRGALRAIRAAVTGLVNLERRRRQLSAH